MEKVALLKCDKYDLDLVEKKIREGFELLGGDSFLKKLIPYNSKLLLKPNLLTVVKEKGDPALTHYIVFEAVIRILKDYTNDITFGDSPGFESARKVASKAGLIEVGEKYGLKFNDFTEDMHVKNEKSILLRSLDVAKASYECDVLITLPRLKTHGMAYYTGAIKNQFGCISGVKKAQFHARMPQEEKFSRMLLDINNTVNTKFAILDGIIAMEGNGPRNGNPYNLKSIVMGECISAVDSVGARLIGYDNPLDIPVLKAAHESQFGAVIKEEIEIVGEQIEDLSVDDFKLCRASGKFEFTKSPLLNKLFKSSVTPDPTLTKEKCINCKRCMEVCPEEPKIIKMEDKDGKLYPVWDLKRCIKCFCCQELCPVGAIYLKQKPIGKLLKMNNK